MNNEFIRKNLGNI